MEEAAPSDNHQAGLFNGLYNLGGIIPRDRRNAVPRRGFRRVARHHREPRVGQIVAEIREGNR